MRARLERPRRVFASPRRSSLIEGLECRQLLSAAASTVVHPNVVLQPAASSSATIYGYTPSQIKTAYGFNNIALASGVTGDGSGQTIAIVDAYNDPNIAADLKVFDQAFGLADPPSLKVVNQSGGSSLPKTDAGWSGEIALDVEWAHAIAPKANILLVEANSDSLGDLLAAVNTARKAAGVSVVSMSWGGSEFRGETAYDSYFTTPAGHQGVTFISASGDSGSGYGAEWPSTSPNVLSVGGSSLYISSSAGAYYGETGWSGSGGGVSSYETEPTYQASAQSTGRRSNPDVSYNADPNTGFAVYDSVSYQGYVGWQVDGGTSAGAPQWAALIAIANQGRAQQGLGSLDGASGTIPALYALYASPTSASYSSYTSQFHDENSGASSAYYRAHSGYDGVTGLGTPRADMVVSALVSAASGTTSSSVRSAVVLNSTANASFVHDDGTTSATPVNATLTATGVEISSTSSTLSTIDDGAGLPVERTTIANASVASGGFRASSIAGPVAFSSTPLDAAVATTPAAVESASWMGTASIAGSMPAAMSPFASAALPSIASVVPVAVTTPVAADDNTSAVFGSAVADTSAAAAIQDADAPEARPVSARSALCVGGVLLGAVMAAASADSDERDRRRSARWPFAATFSQPE